MLGKSEVDKWIIQHQKELKTIIAGMCAKHNLVAFTSDLFNNSYIYVSDKCFVDELDLRKTFINYAKKQLEWSDTYFKKEIFICNNKEKAILQDSVEDLDDLEEKIKEHKDYTDQIGAIELYRLSLTEKWQMILFECYFIKEKNTKGKLAKHLKISPSVAADLIKELRNDIIRIYQAQGGTLGKKPNKCHRKKSQNKTPPEHNY